MIACRPYPLALAIGAALMILASRPADAMEAVSTAPYRDRIIAQEGLQPLPPDEDEQYNDEGLPRSLHAGINLSHSERGDETFSEQGVSAGGFWETATLGNFSLDAGLFRSNRDRFQDHGGIGGTITLWQRDLYLDGGWRGNNGLGILNTPLPPLQFNQYRFFMPTVALAGVATEWRNDARDLLLQGSFGRAGIYNGTRMVGFDIADGNVVSLGTQWSWAPQWTGAATFLGTQGRIVPDDRGEALFEPGDTQAVYAGTSWKGAHDSVQFNLLSSDGDQGPATGAWIDASSRKGRYVHNYGAFRLDPRLSWGALPINNDAEGVYYRVGYQYARWSWNGGVDTIRSISGDGFDGVYATAFGRYQAGSRLGYGASLNLRHASGGDSHSSQLFVDQRNNWGQARMQLDLARTGNEADSWQVSVDQSFALKQGRRLSASLAHGSLAHDGESPDRSTSLTLYGGGDLTDTLSLDGSAHWSRNDGPSSQRGSDFNLGLSWRVRPRWSLSAMLYQSEGSQRSPFVLDPLVTEAPFVSLPRDRSVFLTLRYDHQAGRSQAVLGGAPGGGASGSVSGSLFLDENDDGQRAASEQPAANVTVILDGRYSVRTDSLGNFSFPRVAAGAHAITVVPDNLPLPWFIADGDGRSVQVHVRQDSHVEIGAQRRR